MSSSHIRSARLHLARLAPLGRIFHIHSARLRLRLARLAPLGRIFHIHSARLRLRLALPLLMALVAGACATAEPERAAEPGAPPRPGRPTSAPVARVEPLPDAFRSDDFVVTFARPGDTAETLAERHLGEAAKAWMITDYMGRDTFAAGDQVIIPLRPWNPAGVETNGYQLVPILCYHNLAQQAKGRLVLAASSFEEQMRYLKKEGYRVISLGEFVEFMSLKRQLPRKSVVLTFDDGYRAFKEFAYPILKELGFTATLFVYTDYVGAGRNALSWDELKTLAAEGFDVQGHSKTHGDLRRAPNETDAQFARRMQVELEQPLALFQQRLGGRPYYLAYPYGREDDDVVKKAKEYGYIAAFTVRRQGSAAFVHPLRGHRSQIYSEMSLEDFVKNINVFAHEELK
jgi:peptidoglycan/xylan/chitin deacetylase (PgdA/CDA1 family)